MSRKNMDLDSVGDEPAPQGGCAELPHPQSGELVSSPLLKPDPRGLEWLIPGVGSPLRSPLPASPTSAGGTAQGVSGLNLALHRSQLTLTEPSYEHLKSSGHQKRLHDAPESPEGARRQGPGARISPSLRPLSQHEVAPHQKQGPSRQPPPCGNASEPELSSPPRWFLPPVSHFQRQPMLSP